MISGDKEMIMSFSGYKCWTEAVFKIIIPIPIFIIWLQSDMLVWFSVMEEVPVSHGMLKLSRYALEMLQCTSTANLSQKTNENDIWMEMYEIQTEKYKYNLKWWGKKESWALLPSNLQTSGRGSLNYNDTNWWNCGENEASYFTQILKGIRSPMKGHTPSSRSVFIWPNQVL